ncbi:MAG: hypothetical protein KC729_20940, partial [Candidatus Eisenbacteria bacterium]|nr:hypothetical protein [Candidatus Eisenbacteria bacterium]
MERGLGSALVFAVLTLLGTAVRAGEPNVFPDPDPGPDVIESGSVDSIRAFTTGAAHLPASVAYVPDSDSVPSPADVLGHVVGAPDRLSDVESIHGYFRRLAAASDRVTVESLGFSEEGREMILVRVSAPENLARSDSLDGAMTRLADPRVLEPAEAGRLIDETVPSYYLLGGLHSTETGSPEMLMELAYRLAVSERPEIVEIRNSLVVLITP